MLSPQLQVHLTLLFLLEGEGSETICDEVSRTLLLLLYDLNHEKIPIITYRLHYRDAAFPRISARALI